VNLREKLGLAAGIAVQRMIVEANQGRTDTAELTGKLAEGYLLYGVESWTLTAENGSLIPVSEASIRTWLLDDFSVAAPVADAADDLYMAAVILPLVKKAERSSPTTPTNGSTSRPRAGTRKARKPSKPSSTTTIPTDVTETISSPPAGVSSS
jgi:hypothetical protein